MRKPLRSALAILVLLAASVPASAQDAGLDDAQRTPASVVAVQSGGFWQRDGQEGFYRVLVVSGGFEHVVSRLFIQWVAFDPDARAHKAARTVEVKELGIVTHVTPTPKFAIGNRSWTMAVSVTRRDGKREQRTVTVQPDGAHSVR